MRRIALGSVKVVARAVGYGAFGAFVVALVGFVVFLNRRPDLSVWHTADLDAEFTADSAVRSFDEYLALEERLFRQLDERVYDRIGPGQRSALNRYHRGSLADPARWPRNWNRSYWLPAAAPRAGAVLVHGMSDSPYSLRHVAELLNEAGVSVVGLRVPGHGTAPVGLTRATWRDMAAALRLAVLHVHERIGDRPIHLVGYSNGAALAVHYALTQLDDPALPAPERIVLFSPEIGISPAAALAIWQERIGRLLGLEKLAWNSVLPEYDPYKYQSFAVNAGDQAYRLTLENARLIADLAARDRLGDMPPVLAFQSAVDATVSTAAVVSGLMSRLPEGGHELVLFDLNRWTDIEQVLRHDPIGDLRALVGGTPPTYTVHLVTNASESSREVVLRSRDAGQSAVRSEPLGLRWPDDTFSLSHVALPFPPTDPLYGDARAEPSPGIQLGHVALRGERGVLQVSAEDMLRQRSNPFYAFVEAHLLGFLGLQAPATPDTAPVPGSR